MNIRSRVEPTGGSAILQAWRQQHGPEAQRMALRSGGTTWGGPGGPGVRLLAGNGLRPVRSYMAAANDRLVADLGGLLGDISGNAEVRMSLKAMRRRSRQLANDNEWIKRFLQLVRDNVTGPRGFGFQSKIYKARKKNGVRELDIDANDAIESGYAAQSKLGNFTACGKYTRATFERALVTSLARDGEIVIEKLVGASFGTYGIQWRLIDPDLLDDALNIQRGGVVPGFAALDAGNDIRMGVERNAYGRPVAYWFLTVHPGDDLHGGQVYRHRRVPADRVIHQFLAEELRPDTTRGVPWVYAAIRRMAMLAGFEEAALVNARTGASKMGWFIPPAAGAAAGLGAIGEQQQTQQLADGEDAAGNLVTEAEPGTFGKLPPGWDFKQWDPKYPDENTDVFVKAMLRAFSSSVGLTYNTIGNDLAGVSLSAMRHGSNQDRDTYEAIQQWMRDHVCVPMFEPWLFMGLSFGRLGTLPVERFDAFNQPRFIARPYRSPDPQKDVAAGAQEVALGTNSRTRIAAEKGLDIEEVMEELAQEEAMAKRKGVTLGTAAAMASKNPPTDHQGTTPKPGAEDEDETTTGASDDDAT